MRRPSTESTLDQIKTNDNNDDITNKLSITTVSFTPTNVSSNLPPKKILQLKSKNQTKTMTSKLVTNKNSHSCMVSNETKYNEATTPNKFTSNEHTINKDETHCIQRALNISWKNGTYSGKRDSILDSGCSRSVFDRVDNNKNRRRCNVNLHGIGSVTKIKTTGDVGTILKDVLEHPATPINLVSLGSLLTLGPWSKIIFEVSDINNRTNQTVWGTSHLNTKRVLLAYRTNQTNGLYRCTSNVTGMSPTMKNMNTEQINPIANASVDTEEEDQLLKIVRQLGFPSVSMLRQLMKSPYNISLRLTKKMIARYARMPKEARLAGGMKKSIFNKTTGRGEIKTTPGYSPNKIEYLHEIQADTSKLKYPGRNGEKYSWDLVDRATGTESQVLHKTFKGLALLVKRKLVQMVDTAKRKNLTDDPKILRVRMDGHQSQISKFPQTIAEVEASLLEMVPPVATNPTSPGLSRQMGRIGISQCGKTLTAETIFHEQGAGLPTWCYAKALVAASLIRDFYAQAGHNGKSSFELREGRPYRVSDMLVPLFSTAYYKNPAETGAKQGYSGIGVLIGYRPQINAHEIWVPKTDQILIRAGCNFNSRFSTFKTTRIADMRAGRQVHQISDQTTTRVTRQLTKAKNALRCDPVYHNGILQYYHAKMEGIPLEKPFCCTDTACPNHRPLNGFKSLTGLKRHLTTKAKRVRLALEALKPKDTMTPGGAVSPGGAMSSGGAVSSGGADNKKDTAPLVTEALEKETLPMSATNTNTTNQESENQDKIQLSTKNSKKSKPSKKNNKKAKTMLMLKQIRTYKSKKNKNTIKSKKTQPIRRSTRNKIIAKALAANSMAPFECSHPAIQQIAKDAIKQHHYMATYGDQDSGLMIINHIPTPKQQTPTETPEQIQGKYDKETNMFSALAEQEERTSFEDEKQANYEDIKYQQDKSPQWEPSTPYTTLRAFFGLHDKDKLLFENTCTEYKTPDIFSEAWEVEGFHTSIKSIKLGPDFRPILTLENGDRWTPKFAHQVRFSPFAKELYAAMEREITTLNQYRSFQELKSDPLGKRLITLRWVYKIKFKDGVFERFKARLVGRGFTQIAGSDYDPEGISSPVARNSTFMAVQAEAVKLKYFLKSFDVRSAYLLADLNEDVYAKVPYGMYVDKNTKCLKILKSLYGLKQSGYNWFSKLSGDLKQIGFTQSKVDPCFFNLKRKEEVCRICIWVDDGLVSVSSEELWEEIKTKIDAKNPLSQAGPLEFLLGMAIHHDRKNSILKISQETRIQALLERHNMSNCHGVSTPLPDGEKVTSTGCPTNADEEYALAKECNFDTYADMVTYVRGLIGVYGYLSCWGRPDIRFATYFMARYQSRPSKRHYQLVKRMMRYLQQTKDLCLIFNPANSVNDLLKMGLQDEHPLYGMVDSNYTNAEDTKSTTGYVFYLYGCPIVCESKKQRATCHSTTESELIAASLAARRCNYLRRLLEQDFGLKLSSTPIGEDNQGCIDVSRGGGSHARMRHIRVADSYIYQEFKLNNTIQLRYVPSADNVSDIFTKALGKVIFTLLRGRLMGKP